ncbi:MAG: winged helix-turn-helix domain-containing protein [Henriciella sp.]|uniref:winged helix-turn-helix domain-containing protein n=1 Tax=Henriciella sp. TaxID=1968823 RepID=UPI003C725FF8
MASDAETSERRAAFWVGSCMIRPDQLIVDGPGGEISIEPKVMQVLVVLAAHAGETVLREDLIQSVWERNFGADESLTRAVSHLRKLFRDKHNIPSAIETVPKHGYRLILPVSSTAPAIPSAEQQKKKTPAAPPRRRMALVAAGLMCAVLVAAGLFFALARDTNEAPSVLATEYLASGPIYIGDVTEIGDASAVSEAAEILRTGLADELARNSIPSGRLPRTGAQDLPIIAEASVGGGEDELTITIRVVDWQSGSLLWSATHGGDGISATMLANQAESHLARTLVCAQTRAALLPPDTTDIIGALLSLCANHPFSTHDNSGRVARLIEERNPDDHRARAFKVWADVFVAPRGYQVNPTNLDRSEIVSAMDEIDSILEMHPDSFYANRARMAYDFLGRRDYAATMRRLETLVDDPKQATELGDWHMQMNRLLGHVHDASIVLEAEMQRHPSRFEAITELGWLHAVMGEYGLADAMFERVSAIDPADGLMQQRRFFRNLFYAEAEEAASGLFDIGPLGERDADANCYRTFLELKLSDQQDAAALVAPCSMIPDTILVSMYAQLGDIDRAFDLLNTSLQDANWGWQLLYYPELAELRADPRFWEFAHKMKLVAYWLETDHWPDFCETDDLPERCEASAQRVMTASQPRD